MCRMLTVLLVVYALVGLICHGMPAPFNDTSVTTAPRECVAWLETLMHPTQKTYGARFTSKGCWHAEPMALNITRDGNATNSDPSPELRIACAEKCLLRWPARQKLSLAFVYGKCYCVDPNYDPYGRTLDNTTCCSSQYTNDDLPMPECAPLFSTCRSTNSCLVSGVFAVAMELNLLCTTNLTTCETSSTCELRDDCCIPRGSAEEESQLNVTLMQWCASILMLAICLQGVFWILRTSRRAQNGGDDDEALSIPLEQTLRSREASATAAAEAILLFPPVSRTIVKDKGNCGFCLDSLAD